METNAMGKSVPPRGFTWDRFGPPLMALSRSFTLIAIGVAMWIVGRLFRSTH